LKTQQNKPNFIVICNYVRNVLY